ncbi:hypothetical protein C8J56DRAFT_958331 [Mycena floridula]|nr:hypothetical protein C8J56DRAFT_958331 [Mycena floridula]
MLLSCVVPSTMKNRLKRLVKRKNKDEKHATELVPFPAPALGQFPATDQHPVAQNAGFRPQAPAALNEIRAEPVHVLPRAPAQPNLRDGPAEPVPFVDGPIEQFEALNLAPAAERFQTQAPLVRDGARMERATVVAEPVPFLDEPRRQVVALNQGPLPTQDRVQTQAPQVLRNGARALESAPVAPALQHHAHTVNGPISHSRPSGSSTNFRATYAGIKNCLDAVSKLAFPGIGTAASGVRIAMENVQAQRQVQIDLVPIQKRIERLWFYIHRAQGLPGALEDPELFAPIESQLNRLAVDIKAAVQQNRIAAFFNGTDDLANFASHQRDIDSHIQDLMFFIMTSTKQKTAALHEECNKAVATLRAESPPEEPYGISNTMRNNKFQDIYGGAFVDNEVEGPGRITNIMENNTFGNIRGGFMRGNKIRANTTPGW